MSKLLPERGLGQREHHQSAAEHHRQDRSHRVRVLDTEYRREHRREPLVFEAVQVELDVGGFEHADAGKPQQPSHCRVRGDAEHEQHDQGLEVSAAEADEVALPAARAERHADAERDAADDVAEPAEIGGEVHRTREVDEAGGMERLGAENREADRKEPSAEAAERAHVQHVAHRAHRAEAGPVGDESENRGQDEAADGHQMHDGELEVFQSETSRAADGRPMESCTLSMPQGYSCCWFRGHRRGSRRCATVSRWDFTLPVAAMPSAPVTSIF